MKIALLIYPEFSLYEITPLTAKLTLEYQEKIDVIASQKSIYRSEDGFQVIPHFSLHEIDLSSYDLILLTGSMAPFSAVNDVTLIDAISKVSLTKTVIASISSSPLILAKAGLLDDYDYTGGIYRNYFDTFLWLNKSRYQPRVCNIDRNLITAVGSSEGVLLFTETVLAKLNLTKGYPKIPNEAISFTLKPDDYQKMLSNLLIQYPNIN
ncbi:DJ-1/PfpI family protein [Streptococcus porcinus]|uniref:DJ-1/PfpI family protein n=2 Tax=Streptococcus porcinus TaxID=1340 RepID=A0A4V0H8I9_STRPO|nr:DJ-1/PfpI family protein [Streptococcus porcinus]EGJ27531.1 DJ-1/PfpI family protein [Streptococcus porcinus str. Jelinkova 176]SQG44997.1 DJ-1/PfpI family protein [Streptococcus porcinus]VTT45671.1 DJ-1/PfpI family protein [Streptococcus porcinus]VTT47076.1 DJ-1/PfpI family protein [Streptococcus porcinus]